MEAVRAFNNELSGLYETKPPVSRAKMAQITKSAIKAIKYYKHVVQSVEKFIQKCKPEYKVPGLYVIDSVVRQSRHQFGAQKDVFGPRFTKNIITTFQNLFKCPGDERSKIVRVLNLWQKNEVFPSEIIQPLLDLAADPTKPSLIAAAQAAVDHVVAASGKTSSHHQQPPQHGEPVADSVSQAAAESVLATQNDMLNTVTQLLQQTNSGETSLSAQQQQLQQLQLLQQQLIQQTALMQQPSGGAPLIDANLLAQIQTLTNQLLQKTEAKPEEGFNKKLLDFDYGESDDEDDRKQGQDNVAGNVQNVLNDTGLMQQIHEVSQSLQRKTEYSAEMSEHERRRILEQQQAEFDQQIAQPQESDQYHQEEGEYLEEAQDEDFREQQEFRDRDDRDRRDRRRRSSHSRDKSRSRTPKRRKRTRSRSRDRRRRSRSRDRHRRSRSRERERKEKERERKKKGLPAVRGNFVTICTTTIWIGHLNKFTSEEELKTELEHYGPVENINMVPPRGCAYVVMTNRKDAYKAIDRLKGHKLNGSSLKTAWAQSTAIRESEFKDSWDLDEGAMYIPWESLPSDLSPFLDGAIIDGDSLPDHLKDIPTEKVKMEAPAVSQPSTQPSAAPVPSQAPMPQMPGQPSMIGMMGGMPGMMPGMMMPMQRPVVSGMPPQPMPMPPGVMTPGAPPQMMPGAVPGMPPRPPGAGVMPGPMPMPNMPSTAAATSLAQTIQNIMSTTAGVIPSSPSVPPRPAGFTPGAQPRFGFNPNMPPPGFRMPPPGFGSPMRPPMMGPGTPAVVPPGTAPGAGPTAMPASKPSEVGERLSMLAGQPKQPEMMWPPDSNEKDDDMDEDEPPNEEISDMQNNLPLGHFGRGQRPPLGSDQGPMRMMGPAPPGGFPPGGPPGPLNQPWSMNQRMGGPRGMMPPMGPRMGNQDRFGSPMNQRMGGPGPRGPPFSGGPGFNRFGGPRGPNRGPVSLLDLEFPEKETFKGDRYDNNIEEENETGEEQGEEGETVEEEKPQEEPEQEDLSNVYPFNTWKTVENREKSGRGQDRDRDDNNDRGDRHDSRERNRSRDYGRSRDRSRERDRDRYDRDRDWRHKDDRRDDRGREWDRDRNYGRDRGDRDRGERDRGERDKGDRERTRKSRWGSFAEEENKDETTEKGMNSGETAAEPATGGSVENKTEKVQENTNISEEGSTDISEKVQTSDVKNQNIQGDNNSDKPDESESGSNVLSVDSNKENIKVGDENTVNSGEKNGPVNEINNVSEPTVEPEKLVEEKEKASKAVDMDLEEGEISS